jgi:hypothetical protein
MVTDQLEKNRRRVGGNMLWRVFRGHKEVQHYRREMALWSLMIEIGPDKSKFHFLSTYFDVGTDHAQKDLNF